MKWFRIPAAALLSAVLAFLFPPTLAHSTTTRTIETVYPSLASGALTYASLGELPTSQVLRSGSLAITDRDLETGLAEIPTEIQEEMKKNLFFLLEQKATKALLLRLAKEKSPKGADPSEDELTTIRRYLKGVVASIEVTDAELAEFYANNKALCGDATFDQIKEELKRYVTQNKREQAVSEHIRTLGRRRPIVVSAPWVERQAALAFDNAVDKARASGKPTLVDFWATGCHPCEVMAPLLENLKTKYEGKMNVELIHTDKYPILAERYGVEAVPVQVLFDKDGKEVWRNVGFILQERIEEQIAKAGFGRP